MFTGIVEETGIVQAIRPGAGGIGLWVRASRCGRGLKTGDSLAINGCCLTVEKIGSQPGGQTLLRFTVLNETWQRTNLQFAAPGAPVNLERALRVGDPLGGHFCHRAYRQHWEKSADGSGRAKTIFWKSPRLRTSCGISFSKGQSQWTALV